MDITFSAQENLFRDEVRTWIHENKPKEKRPLDGQASTDFDIAWQRTQFEGGWAGINWPTEYGGRGLSLFEQIIWFQEYATAKAPWIGANFVGINHGGPTLIVRASEEQKSYHLPRILKGEDIWCQGFSEPGAGSDLAGIRTSAVIDGDEMVINGSKIWTSFAMYAKWQELIVRTEPGSQRHRGLSWVICDMEAPGIDIRPIRNMSGETEFCQVFYDDVRIPVANCVGGLGNGWSVAMSTLGFERGTGFIYEQVKLQIRVEEMIKRAKEECAPNGRPWIANERIAEQLAMFRAEVASLAAITYRTVSEVKQKGQPGPESSVVRLFTAELTQRVDRMEMELLGQSILDYTYGQDDEIHDYLRHFAGTIAGGASQIQRNIIGERVLGLPK